MFYTPIVFLLAALHIGNILAHVPYCVLACLSLYSLLDKILLDLVCLLNYSLSPFHFWVPFRRK